jgi:phage terminase large subunit
MRVVLPNNFAPRPYQKRLMGYFDRGGKRAMAVWHRRAGKDLLMLHQTGKMAHERKGVYWHTLPTYRQAKKALWDGFTKTGERTMEQVFPGFLDPKRPGSIVAGVNQAEMLLELRCGSLVQLVGSDNIDTLVGAGPVHVTFSEYALCKPTAWDLVRPMLRENGGSAAFISTPRGKNHAFKLYEMARKNPAWFCELLTIFESGAFPDPQAVIDEERAEGMLEELIRQEYLCDFAAAVLGSVWAELIEALEKRGALEPFEHETDGVFTSWDLGFTDSTAIWFWRLCDDGVDVIDHYEAHGKPLSHFFDELELRAKQNHYRYVKHWLPHDADHHTLSSGTSILNQFLERYGTTQVAIGPKLSRLDGIQAGRWLLQQNVRFHPRCKDGVEALRAYRYEYDEDRKTFTKNPVHDWASHSADAFRYLATVVRVSELLRPRPAPELPKRIVIEPEPVTLGNPWDIEVTVQKEHL